MDDNLITQLHSSPDFYKVGRVLSSFILQSVLIDILIGKRHPGGKDLEDEI